MTKPMVRIHNSQTDEIIDREMNADELAQLETDKAAVDLRAADKAQAASDKAIAQSKLEALGLIADDLKALGL